MTPVTWSNIDRVVRLDRALWARVGPLFAKSWDQTKYFNDLTRLTKDENATFSYVTQVAPLITAQIGSVLKTPQPSGTQIDLSSTFLSFGDWKDIDFGEANIENADFNGMDLRGAKLNRVTRFSGVAFAGIAWWEVKSINRPLFEYLKQHYAFDSRILYGLNRESKIRQEYDAAISRLDSQLK